MRLTELQNAKEHWTIGAACSDLSGIEAPTDGPPYILTKVYLVYCIHDRKVADRR